MLYISLIGLIVSSPRSSKPDIPAKSKRPWWYTQQVNLLIHLTDAGDISYFRARCHTGRRGRAYCSPAQLEAASGTLNQAVQDLHSLHCKETNALRQFALVKISQAPGTTPGICSVCWHLQHQAPGPLGEQGTPTQPFQAKLLLSSQAEFFTWDGKAEQLLPQNSLTQKLWWLLPSTVFAWWVNSPVQVVNWPPPWSRYDFFY